MRKSAEADSLDSTRKTSKQSHPLNRGQAVPPIGPYVLFTPACNEARHIEKLIHSILAQTLRPMRWIIVCNNCTDDTEQIARRYAKQYPFIEVIAFSPFADRNFSAKVQATQLATRLLKKENHAFIGNLDGDISFDDDYFETLIERFHASPRLGIAGGTIYERKHGRFRPRFGNTERSVPGAVQLFRRECYEQIGGYQPLRYGGIDTVAEGMAKQRGWQIHSFQSLPVLHYRLTGRAGLSLFQFRVREGIKEYALGTHLLFFVFKCLWRIHQWPWAIGSLLRIIGYLTGAIRQVERPLPASYLQYQRSRQLRRLIPFINPDKQVSEIPHPRSGIPMEKIELRNTRENTP